MQPTQFEAHLGHRTDVAVIDLHGQIDSFAEHALDLGAVKRALNSTVGVASRLDVNHDGRINALDLGAIKGNLNASLAALTAPAAGAAGAVRSTLVPFSNVAIAPMSALDAAKRTGVWDALQA